MLLDWCRPVLECTVETPNRIFIRTSDYVSIYLHFKFFDILDDSETKHKIKAILEIHVTEESNLNEFVRRFNLSFSHRIIILTTLFVLKCHHSEVYIHLLQLNPDIQKYWDSRCDDLQEASNVDHAYLVEDVNLVSEENWKYVHESMLIYWTVRNIKRLQDFPFKLSQIKNTKEMKNSEENDNEIQDLFEQHQHAVIQHIQDIADDDNSDIFYYNPGFESYHIQFDLLGRHFEINAVGRVLKIHSCEIWNIRKIYSGMTTSIPWLETIHRLRKQISALIRRELVKRTLPDVVDGHILPLLGYKCL